MEHSRREVLGAAAALLSASALAQTESPVRESAPRPGTPDERRILEVLADLYRDHRYLSVPEEDGRLLRILAKSRRPEWRNRPRWCSATRTKR